MSVALPAIRAGYQADAQQVQWVVNAYLLPLSALLLLGGALGDHFGRRRLLVTGTGIFGLTSLVAFGITVAAVRLIVGPGHLILPFGHHYGWDLFRYNVTRAVTWDNVFRTLTVVPFIALWQLRRWPVALQTFALAVVPVWFAVHLFAAVIAETRLLLVPYVLVFVPGALMGFRAAQEAVSGHPPAVSA